MLMRSLYVLCAVVLNATSISSTSVVAFSFDSLCKVSKSIAHVTCVSSESIVAEDGIRTRTVFRVIKGVKGDVGREIEIALPGGRIGDQRVSVPGMPRFQPGEETVIFLSGPDGHGSAWPVGLRQGCYRVTEDADAERNVQLKLGTTPIPGGALFKPAQEYPHKVTLTEFLDTVRETLAPEPAFEK